LIRCRLAACRESLEDSKEWSFYLINDGENVIESAILSRVSYEWGDSGTSETPNVQVAGLAPGASALIWRDDGSGAELRMEFSIVLRADGRQIELRFEFPKLYRQRNLPFVAGLDKPGWQERGEG